MEWQYIVGGVVLLGVIGALIQSFSGSGSTFRSLRISQEAYDKANTAMREGSPLAQRSLRFAKIVASMYGVTPVGRFDPASIIARWTLAYHFQIGLDEYPESLSIFEIETTNADNGKAAEYRNKIIEDAGLTGAESFEEGLKIVAQDMLAAADHLGPVGTELQQHMTQTGYHPQVNQFVLKFVTSTKEFEFATQRLLSEGKVTL
jgi:hypothetical protein